MPAATLEAQSRPAALAEVRHLCTSGTAREIREKAGLRLFEVAEHVGVSLNTISYWERSRSRPTGDHALTYLALLRELAGRYLGREWRTRRCACANPVDTIVPDGRCGRCWGSLDAEAP